MLEAQIPKDVRKYEAKLIGPFSTRETVCVIIAGVLSYGSYSMLSPVQKDIAIYTAFFLACIPILFGWVKPYNVTLEKFLMTVLVSLVLAPKYRKYASVNVMREAGTDFKVQTQKEYKKRLKIEKKLLKKDPNREVMYK